MEWGEIVRRLREQKGLTQQNLADELKVDKTTIVRWEQDGNIKTPQLEKIARALSMEPSRLYEYHYQGFGVGVGHKAGCARGVRSARGCACRARPEFIQGRAHHGHANTY